ncbi:hypothetical protein MHTCC0001_25380 [Flavobacteriaceae bacterium MHTCC 0001]
MSFFKIEAQYLDWTEARIFLKNGNIIEGHARLKMQGAIQNGSALNLLSPKEYLLYINKEIKQRRSTKFIPEEVDSVLFTIRNKFKDEISERVAKYIVITKVKKKRKEVLGFTELIIGGTVKLVEKGIAVNSRGGGVMTQTLLIREDEEPLIVFNSLMQLKSFKKRVLDYFKDCSILIDKIENEWNKLKDIKAIVKFYNDNCAK